VTDRTQTARWLLLTVAITVVLGVFFRFYQLDRKVFWEDEILGVVHMFGYTEAEVVEASPKLANAAAVQRYVRLGSAGERRPLAATVRSLAVEDPQHPPLYYLAGRLWAQVFGSSAAAIRSLPALFGVLVLPCAYFFCLELFGSSSIALIAVALVAVSPFFVLYSQEAREFSMWTVVILLNALLFLRASRSHAALPWTAYAAITALAFYIYPLSGLVVLGFGAYLLLRDRCRVTKILIAYATASLAAFAAFIPWLLLMASSGGVERGMSGISRGRLSPGAIALVFARDLRSPFVDFGSFHVGPLSSTAVNFGLTIFVFALVAYALTALVRGQRFAVWGFVVVGLCLPMAPLLLRDLLIGGNFVYQARYFTPLLLGVQLAVAALFGGTIYGAARRTGLTLFAVVLTGEILSCIVSAGADTWWNKDYERTASVAEIVDRSARPMIVSDYFSPSVLALSFYLDPRVALRLNLRCAQCTAPITAGLSDPTPRISDFDMVFMLQLAATPENAHQRWINPKQFPRHPRPLNMFLAI
jgi:uncharacterized membrane protein